jgi:uncharacterized protein YjbI with pentapeptide repeats
MAGRVSVDWLTCDEDECLGICLDAGHKCLAHAEDEERAAALGQVAQTGIIEARGVTISSSLFKRILDSTPRNPDGNAMFTEVHFNAATFQSDADFSNATFQGSSDFRQANFQGNARFGGATFQGIANFSQATFQGAGFGEVTFQGGGYFDAATFDRDASFEGATFPGSAEFNNAIFQGSAGFNKATFQGRAWFMSTIFQQTAWFLEAKFTKEATSKDSVLDGAVFLRATFEGDAWFAVETFEGNINFNGATIQGSAAFDGATIRGNANFRLATFQSSAGFSGVTFEGDAQFKSATFQGDAGFNDATFHGDAEFDGAMFGRAKQFGPLLARKGLDLDSVQFAQLVRIEASTISLCCRGGQFPGGVQFRLHWAGVVLEDTDIPAPSLLIGIPSLASKELASAEQQMAADWKQEYAGQVSEQPRLLSLRRTNVAGLGLANVDLAGCRFSGAHNLDELRLEADVAFRLSPALVGWEQRQVVAEECTWRAARARPGLWADPWWPDQTDPRWPEDLEKPMALAPEAIAGLYRALRKSREDAKDEPGAADFYYGEMEMRRHAHGQTTGRGDGGSRGRVDRSVLTAYWLVSGYGLRAWRALAWLAGITVAFAFAFHLVGFTSPPQPATYWTSLLYAFRSTISLTDDAVNLTAWGQLLQALLRLTGPVLLGLALLALRGRIKR